MVTKNGYRVRALITVFVVAIIVALAVYFFKGRHSASFRHSPADTVKTLVIYSKDKLPVHDIAFRVDKDSFMFVGIDSATFKKKWTRAHDYYIPVPDTIRDATGHPKKDSTGKYQMGTFYYPVVSQIIWADMGLNLDSLVKVKSK